MRYELIVARLEVEPRDDRRTYGIQTPDLRTEILRVEVTPEQFDAIRTAVLKEVK